VKSPPLRNSQPASGEHPNFTLALSKKRNGACLTCERLGPEITEPRKREKISEKKHVADIFSDFFFCDFRKCLIVDSS